MQQAIRDAVNKLKGDDLHLFSEGQKILYIGGLIGFLGEPVIGKQTIKEGQIACQKEIKEEINYANKNNISLKENGFLKSTNDLIREGTFTTNYFKHKLPIANFKLEDILYIGTNLVDIEFRHLTNDIIAPLVRINIIKKNKQIEAFHPNYLLDIKNNDYLAIKKKYGSEFPIEITNIADELFKQRFEEEIKPYTKSFSPNKRITFEQGLSDLAIRVYSFFIKECIEPQLNN